eukprot:Anaeramoba_ignava/c20039_g1_i1.p1 GENE.c20039_g1_i1~~c20039_g1_i1.p1  ORF type:complete len:143 (+),score=38.79 c20039_g1_i1:106-534(+)
MKIKRIFLLIFLIIIIMIETTETKRLFENRYSFRGDLKNWQIGEDAILDGYKIILTEDKTDKQGFIWNNLKNDMKYWTSTITFNIEGKKVGADGIAFWYTKFKGISGPVFGNMEKFVGLGVFLDTYDNDKSVFIIIIILIWK